jgi:hypothetical protein
VVDISLFCCFRSFLTEYIFYGVGLQPHSKTPTSRPGVSLLVRSSPLTYLAREVLPVATLQPA